MAGRYGRKYLKDEDFEEGEVWGVMEENRETSSPKLRKPFKNSSSSSATKHFTAPAGGGAAAPRMIPRSASASASASSPSEKQSSAPVEIPDWSKIYGKTSKKKKNGVSASSWVDYNAVSYDGYHGNGYGHGDDDHLNYDGGHVDVDDDGDGDDDGDDMVPPHEYLAKKLARSQISSFSVYEGIGRTLKGRDLSKVRNAILTKTGFLE